MNDSFMTPGDMNESFMTFRLGRTGVEIRKSESKISRKGRNAQSSCQWYWSAAGEAAGERDGEARGGFGRRGCGDS
jgi:hypothetical protein